MPVISLIPAAAIGDPFDLPNTTVDGAGSALRPSTPHTADRKYTLTSRPEYVPNNRVNPGTPPPTPSDLSDRFAAILESLYQATARTVRDPISGLVILLICARLRRITRRFAALAARYAARTLRPLRTPATEPHPPGLHPPPPRDKLPRGYAWLIRLVPGSANFGTQLQYLLSQPEMAAMIAEVPRMATLVRPLCRALAAHPTPPLPPDPPRIRPPRPPREKPPRPPRQTPDPRILRRKPPPDEPGITWVNRCGMWLPEPIRPKPA